MWGWGHEGTATGRRGVRWCDPKGVALACQRSRACREGAGTPSGCLRQGGQPLSLPAPRAPALPPRSQQHGAEVSAGDTGATRLGTGLGSRPPAQGTRLPGEKPSLGEPPAPLPSWERCGRPPPKVPPPLVAARQGHGRGTRTPRGAQQDACTGAEGTQNPQPGHHRALAPRRGDTGGHGTGPPPTPRGFSSGGTEGTEAGAAPPALGWLRYLGAAGKR